MGPSLSQLLIVLLVVFLVFGSKKLRTLGEDLSLALKGFRQGLHEDPQTNTNNKNDQVDY